MSAELLDAYPKYGSYKESGGDWLGDIPEHWNVLPLDVVSKIKSISGYSNETLLSVYLNEGVIRYNDVKEKRTNVTSTNLDNYQLVDTGDFVLNNQQAWRGSVGVSSYRGIVSPAYIILKLSKSLESNFANYIFRSEHMIYQYVIHSKGVGTIQRNLYWQSFKKSICLIPPISEQTAIADFLDQKTAQIDQAIELKQQQIEKLNEYEQIVIQNAVTKGLSANAKMKDRGIDWLGDIPEHWEVKRLKYVLTERNERTTTGEEPLFMVSQKHGLVVRADYHEKATVAFSNIDNKVVYKNDLVFNKLKAHLGVFYKSEISFKGIVSPDYAVYKRKAYIDDLKFLEILFRHPLYIRQFIIRATGIVEGLIRLYTSELFDLHIAIPPSDEQKEILKFVEKTTIQIDSAKEVLEDQVEKLLEYKTVLINNAVTGKIKVS